MSEAESWRTQWGQAKGQLDEALVSLEDHKSQARELVSQVERQSKVTEELKVRFNFILW